MTSQDDGSAETRMSGAEYREALDSPTRAKAKPRFGHSYTHDDVETTPLVGDSFEVRSPKKGSGSFQRRTTIDMGTLNRMPNTWRIEDALGTMSALAFVVNMFADLCPPGLLPLAFGLKLTGYVAAATLLLVFYSVCVYTMWCVGQTSELTGQHTFRGQWEKTFGVGTSWIPVAVVVIVCFGCNLSYSCFFADIFTGAMPSVVGEVPRSACLIGFTVFPVLPLCMLKDLSVLAPTSFLALLMVFYTAWMMCRRATDGTYASGGEFFAGLSEKPNVPIAKNHLFDFGIGSLQLVNFLAMGFLSHYNGCKYYRELERHTPARLRFCTSTAMGITSLFYVATTIAGYHTFGDSCKGVILENYAKDDTLANIARFGMGFSIMASFPLMFSGLREATIELLLMIMPGAWSEVLTKISAQNALSCLLVALITVCALIFTDAGLVVGLVGATCGSSIIYIIPCILYAKAAGAMNKESYALSIAISRSVAFCGVIIGTLGVVASLS